MSVPSPGSVCEVNPSNMFVSLPASWKCQYDFPSRMSTLAL
jgi:hypothetical protein